MCKTEQKPFIEKLNAWLQVFAIILGGSWVIYEFYYKEIWVPRNAPINISSKVIVKDSGEKKLDEDYKAIHVTFEIHNTGKKKAVFLPSMYIVWGHKIKKTGENEQFIAEVNSVLQEYEDYQDNHLSKYLYDTDVSIVAAGEIFYDWLLEPQESAQRSTLFFVPKDKFDFIGVEANYLVVNSEDQAYAKWLVDEKNQSIQYSFFKFEENNEIKEIDLDAKSASSDKDFVDEMQFSTFREYQYFNLWDKTISKNER